MTQDQFCQQINNLLLMIDQTNDDSNVNQLIDQVKLSIENIMRYPSGMVYIFGSRSYGLASSDSDVDLYFDCGDCFSGKIASNRAAQYQLIDLFANMVQDKKVFSEILVLKHLHVPIVRFRYFNLKCDLMFRSGLAVQSSRLLKLYLSNKTVRWITTSVVKQFTLVNKLVSDNLSSFSIIWLVLFVLIRQKVIPPVIELWKTCTRIEPYFVEGWDTRIVQEENDASLIFGNYNSDVNNWDLLRSVFEFYSDTFTLKNFILCPMFGELFNKSTFSSEFIIKSDSVFNFRLQLETFKQNKTISEENLRDYHKIILQNPIKLCNNVTPWLTEKNMDIFIDICTKCMKSMSVI
ncbi:terminal uridylyltransferase Tailor-like isoform X2 [Daktulosphaira vitifoliae]|nr:terminal uridylyltransferase Tailor-like isoform X2 [Daktulosphaira vitifoliae]